MTEIQRVQLPELEDEPRPGSGTPFLRGRLDLISNVKVKVTALLGGAEISVARLFDLREGDLIELSSAVNQPVELQLNGKTVALGEIVVAGDQFGLRITQKPQK